MWITALGRVSVFSPCISGVATASDVAADTGAEAAVVVVTLLFLLAEVLEGVAEFPAVTDAADVALVLADGPSEEALGGRLPRTILLGAPLFRNMGEREPLAIATPSADIADATAILVDLPVEKISSAALSAALSMAAAALALRD